MGQFVRAAMTRGVAKRRPKPAAREPRELRIETLVDLATACEAGLLSPPGGGGGAALACAVHALDGFIGAQRVKLLARDMALLSCLGLADEDDFTNVMVTGNPGTGKTELIGLVAEILRALYHGKRSRVTWLTRAHLVGQHLGETALKTARALASAAPGVVVLDEVYALGSGDGRDSFAKECVDTLNQFMSECSSEISVVVAGYKNETEHCFLQQNPGLARRFPHRFHIDDYTPDELCAIAARQLERAGWRAYEGWSSSAIVRKAVASSRFNGGDTARLLVLCKLAHARRIPPEAERRSLTEADVAAGCAEFARTAEREVEPPLQMYT